MIKNNILAVICFTIINSVGIFLWGYSINGQFSTLLTGSLILIAYFICGYNFKQQGSIIRNFASVASVSVLLLTIWILSTTYSTFRPGDLVYSILLPLNDGTFVWSMLKIIAPTIIMGIGLNVRKSSG